MNKENHYDNQQFTLSSGNTGILRFRSEDEYISDRITMLYERMNPSS